jgi:hypothetical protein
MYAMICASICQTLQSSNAVSGYLWLLYVYPLDTRKLRKLKNTRGSRNERFKIEKNLTQSNIWLIVIDGI